MSKQRILSSLPKVDDILKYDAISKMEYSFPRVMIVDSIREEIDSLRNTILRFDEDKLKDFKINIDDLVTKIINSIKKKNKMKLHKVINATGVVLHTNLGRAPISESVIDDLVEVACNYSTLEFNLENGERGSRYSHVEELICKLTGAEAALVVNNNAAAVLLVLDTLAKGKEVIVSRGQLVEIGGSFRVPEVMAQSGAKLVEVGTTNKTHLFDYENNINEDTALILKVHTSNYKIIGFSEEVHSRILVELGEKYNIPVVEDIGSGTLIDFSKYGLQKEPTIQESLKNGVDIVTFSGDKLLGGPQAGIIVGKKEYIDKMKKNQLTRALRIDKMTLVVLEGTLRLYLDEEKVIENIPTLNMLTVDINILKNRAQKLYSKIKNSKPNIKHSLIKGFSQVGGGSMPLEKLPTYIIALESEKVSANKIEEYLRKYNTPIICRISEDKVLLDVRTLKDIDFDEIVEALKSIEGEEF